MYIYFFIKSRYWGKQAFYFYKYQQDDSLSGLKVQREDRKCGLWKLLGERVIPFHCKQMTSGTIGKNCFSPPLFSALSSDIRCGKNTPLLLSTVTPHKEHICDQNAWECTHASRIRVTSWVFCSHLGYRVMLSDPRNEGVQPNKITPHFIHKQSVPRLSEHLCLLSAHQRFLQHPPLAQ